MHVRVGSSPVQDAPGAEGEESPGGPGPVLGGLEGIGGRVRAARALFDRPLTSYYVIVGITTLLLCLGLAMVLSTASYINLSNGKSAYSSFEAQLVGIVVGVPIMWVASRAQPRLFRAVAYPLLAVAAIGLCLTLIPGVARSEGGAARWIAIGPLTVQPAELAKLALAVWGADLLARKERLGMLADWRHMLVPLMPGTGVLAMLVMAEHDLGTTFILLVIFLALLWIAGTPGRVFATLLILMGLVLVLLAVTEAYRSQRLELWLGSSPASNNPLGRNDQAIQAKYALGSGGIFGVGLGAGREKWGWLPESSTDFIFAVIGEELGLVGTLSVTALYGGLAWAGLRVTRRAPDTFSRLLSSAITIWISVQAVVNIGVVIGLFPITGVPLPLVSQGLSSVLVTMVGLGMLMSFARREPEASRALAARATSGGVRPLSWLSRDSRRRTLSRASPRRGAWTGKRDK